MTAMPTSEYLQRRIRSEEEARRDVEATVERQQMLNSALGMAPLPCKTTYQCMDCGAWWSVRGTAERCPSCKCPSPVVRKS